MKKFTIKGRKMDREKLCIKICPNPQCEAIYHNIPKKITNCVDCDGNIIEINEKTYNKKFVDYFFQYDYQTKNKDGYPVIYRPAKIRQLAFDW